IVKFNDRVRTLGNQSFYGNVIRKITIPKNVQEVGIQTFTENRIEEINFENKDIELGPNSFSRNNITFVELPIKLGKGYNDFLGYTTPFDNNPIKQVYIKADMSRSEERRVGKECRI